MSREEKKKNTNKAYNEVQQYMRMKINSNHNNNKIARTRMPGQAQPGQASRLLRIRLFRTLRHFEYCIVLNAQTLERLFSLLYYHYEL